MVDTYRPTTLPRDLLKPFRMVTSVLFLAIRPVFNVGTAMAGPYGLGDVRIMVKFRNRPC